MARDSDRLAAEKRRLQEMELELKRKEEKLRKQLETLPAQVRQKKEKIREKRKEDYREMTRLNATTTARGDFVSRLQHQRGADANREVSTRQHLRKVRREEKIKFMVLGMILLLVLIMLWRAMP